MGQKLLEGEVMDSTNTDSGEVARLRDVNRTLTRELNDALEENDSLRKRVAQADAPITRLREKLQSFYQLLRALFGDIEEIAPEQVTASPTGQPPAHHAAAWDEWKQKLGGAAAKIITALQKHRDADVQQLCILIGTPRKQTIYDAIHKLNKSSLINKNGDRFSLKQL